MREQQNKFDNLTYNFIEQDERSLRYSIQMSKNNKTDKVCISFFFRKKSPVFHSIEELFYSIQNNFATTVSYTNFYATHESKGFFRRLANALEVQNKQSEVNHITGHNHYVAILMHKKRTILTIHDLALLYSLKSIKRLIFKLFWFDIPIRKVRYVTVISEFTKQELLKKIKISEDKIKVIPNAVSPNFSYSPKEFNCDSPVILQIGTKKNKNLERLIEAIKNINCKLLIIGKLSKNQEISLQKNEIDYENKFNLSQEEVVNCYEKADIVSFMSTYEGFGMPIIEANAVGRVIITSNISPMKEVAGEAALFVNPLDVREIERGLKEIIMNADLRQNLIKNGLKNVKRYHISAITEQYFKLYKLIINE